MRMGPPCRGSRPWTTVFALGALPRRGSELAQEREEHPVGAVQVRPQLDGRTVAEVGDAPAGHLLEYGTCVDHLDVGPLLRDVPDDETGLRDVRAAGRVGDDPTRRRGVDRAREQLPLEGPERREVTRLPAPARLRPT